MNFCEYTPGPNQAGTGPFWLIRRVAVLCAAAAMGSWMLSIAWKLIALEIVIDLLRFVYERHYMPRARCPIGKLEGFAVLEVRLATEVWVFWKIPLHGVVAKTDLIKNFTTLMGNLHQSAAPFSMRVNDGQITIAPRGGRWDLVYESDDGENCYSAILPTHDLRALLRDCVNLLG